MTTAQLIAVCRARPTTLQRGGHRVDTGIFKQAVAGPVAVHSLGLAGDHVADARNHGGPDQAVYLYSRADYAWWEEELGRPLAPGIFGENLTLDAWWEDGPRLGDRIRIGDVELELCSARIPCGTLAARMDDPHFVKRFAAARRPGCYARVLREGSLQAGDTWELLPRPDGPAQPSVLDLFDLWYAQPRDPAQLRRLLAAPLAQRARGALEHWLGELG